MNFIEFKKQFQNHIANMEKTSLFKVDIDKDEFWNLYLDSFPKGYNEIYKERREYDCNCCKSFIKHYGGIVAISENNELISIWDVPNLETPFKEVTEALSSYIKEKKISNIFRFQQLFETNTNKQLLEDNTVKIWDHLYYKFSDNFKHNGAKTLDTFLGEIRTSKEVFKRSLEELTLDAAETILELIEQNSLYRGAEFKGLLNEFIKFKKVYNKLPENQKDNWCWVHTISGVLSRIRNISIGTLLIDLSEGVELDQAVRKFESVVAPSNYKRPKPIVSKKMIEEAEKKIIELGYENSLNRRYAKLDDITVPNTLYVNRDVKSQLKDSVFDAMKKEVAENPKNFDKVEEIKIDDFIDHVLPTTKFLEVMIENKHKPNFMSLIAPINEDSKTMFKWNNNFSWAYTGDITDSIRENVKKAGGRVDGILRFSIQWNDRGDYNDNDFDAHAEEPNKTHIYYATYCKKNNCDKTLMLGQLDVDIINPLVNVPAVENIVWIDRNKMKPGNYKFWVNCFSKRSGRSGFSSEIEVDGQSYFYNYSNELRQGQNIEVAEVTLHEDGKFTIKNKIPSSKDSIDIWGVSTNVFTKVNIMSYSPNYWDEQRGIGNKHYFFFLDKCVNDGTPRGFFNEFLNQELNEHKKVFEILGSKMRVQETDNQLSGIGFSSTQRNELTVRVEGKTKRIMKIKF
jgi:hypothetical protein